MAAEIVTKLHIVDATNEAPKVPEPFYGLVKRGATDAGAPFEPGNLLLLADLRVRDPAGYQRVRAALVKEKIGISALEKAIARISSANPALSAGTPFDFEVSEKWPDPVDGDQLFKDVVAVFKRHMVLPPYAPEAMALWVIFTHTHDCWSISPRLALNSPEKRCGKTTALSIIQKLVPKPLPASNITTAALFRSISEWFPTLLIDEADTFLPGNEELRGILNSGHNRSQAYVVRTTPPDFKPAKFSTWAPVIIAMIGRLPDTLNDRSIVINLKRKLSMERVQSFRADRAADLEPLCQRIARWAADNIDKLLAWDGNIPQGLHDRAVDNWRPLFAIAHAMGEVPFDQAQEAAVALTSIDADSSVGILLLKDISSLFSSLGKDRLPTEVILDHLMDLEGRPWPEYRNDKPLTKSQMAKLLKPYGIKSKSMRFDDDTNRKGYVLVEFKDAFERYLPPEVVTPSQRSKFNDLADDESVTPKSDVTAELTEKPNENAGCDGVTAERVESTMGKQTGQQRSARKRMVI